MIRPNSDRGNLPQVSGFETIEGDLTDFPSVLRAARNCNEIYHVAADYRFWSPDPSELYNNNIQGTANILRAAGEVGAAKIVHTSTVGTIGLADQPHPCHEETNYLAGQFTSHYKRSKLKAEELALSYAQKGLPVIIVNPSTPMGPWDRKPTPSGRMIVDFVNGNMSGYTHTGLNFAHVHDVALGHLLAAQKGRVGQRYILGGQNLTLHQFFEMIAYQCKISKNKSLLKAPNRAPWLRVPYSIACVAGLLSTKYADWISKKTPSIPLEAVKMSKRFMFFDSSKAIRELGLPQTPVQSAIDESLEWFLRNGYFIEGDPQSQKGNFNVNPT